MKKMVSMSFEFCKNALLRGLFPVFMMGSLSVIPSQTEGVIEEISLNNQEVISKIEVQGNQRIDAETILLYLKLKEGDVATQEKLNESFKALFGTNFFSDVTFDQQGRTLIVHVQENPIINRVAFEGNQKISSETLDKEIGLSPRTIYTRNKVQAAQQKLLQIYRQSGRFAARVEPKIIKLPENRIDLVFEIEEGPVTQVEKINFVGNRNFSDGTLEAAIQTKESRWYRFFTSDDNYDPDRLNYDQEKLRQFYLNHGYADFKIVSAVAELSPDQKDFFITFTLEEGEKYKFGKVQIESKIPSISLEKLQEAVAFEEDDWYSAKLVDTTVEKMMEVAGEQGYAFVEPKAKAKKNKENQTVDLTFVLEEGPKIYIQRIDIVGNTRTLDSVVRRELTISEGDAFNVVRVRKSLQKIKDLNYFKKVDLTRHPGDAPDKVVLKLEVEEQSTGELMLSGGYGQNIGPLGEISVRERNLLGTGQSVGAKTRIAKRQTLIDFDYEQPYFLGRHLMFGMNAYMKKEDLKSQSSFEEKTNGLGTWIGYELAEYWTQILGYGLRFDHIGGLSSYASKFVRQQKVNTIISSVYQTIMYDRRDSKIDPRSGYTTSLTNEFSGVGGDVKYSKNEIGGTYYYPLGEDVTLSTRGKYGQIFGLGRTLRIADRYNLGGDSLRGFDYAGVSPRDRTGIQDALGGMKFYAMSLESTFPIGLPNEFGIRGSTFIDAGSVWDSQYKSDPIVFDDDAIRVSAGVGLAWRSPMGPLRVNFAWPLKKRTLDKTRMFLFGFSTQF